MFKRRTFFVDYCHGRPYVSDGPHEGQTWEWTWDRVLSLPAKHVVLWAADVYRQLALACMLNQGSWPNGMRLDAGEDGSPRLAFGESPIYCRWVLGDRTITVADAVNLVPGARIDSGWKAELHHLLGLLGCGYETYTASGMGARIMRQLCDASQFSVCEHTDTSLLALHPRAGRCECYRLPYASGYMHHYWDMSLAYLTAAQFPLPLRVVDDDLEGISPIGYDCIADVVIKTDVPWYPYRMRLHDQSEKVITCYPTGTFRTVLCGRELQGAIQAGHVAAVNSMQKWAMGSVLLPYMQHFHKAIENSTGNVRKAIKLIALAGLGATSKREVRWLPCDGFDTRPGFIGDYYRVDDDGCIQRYRRIYGQSYVESPGGWAADASPQIWSWLVSQVRWQVTQAIHALGRNVYYCDTDGLITDPYGSALLKTWSQRWPEHRWRDTGRCGPLTIYGWRRYCLGDGPISGIPDAATQVGIHSWTWDSVEKWDESMQAQRVPDGRMVRRRTSLLGKYEHGVIGDDGVVLPYHIHDDETII